LLFPLLFAFDGLIAAILVYFFATGLSDGSVSSFNLGLWLGMLAGIVVIFGGAILAQSRGYPKIAIAVLLLPIVPAALFVIFVGALIIIQPRWN
jgi:hypothetical protein